MWGAWNIYGFAPYKYHFDWVIEVSSTHSWCSPGTKNPAGAASTPLDSILKEMMPPGDSTVLKFEGKSFKCTFQSVVFHHQHNIADNYRL